VRRSGAPRRVNATHVELHQNGGGRHGTVEPKLALSKRKERSGSIFKARLRLRLVQSCLSDHGFKFRKRRHREENRDVRVAGSVEIQQGVAPRINA